MSQYLIQNGTNLPLAEPVQTIEPQSKRNLAKLSSLLDQLSNRYCKPNGWRPTEINVRDGKLVCCTKHYPDSIYIVRQGILKTCFYDSSGLFWVSSFSRKDDIVGLETFAMSDLGRQTIAVTDTTLLAIPLEIVYEFLRQSEEFEEILYQALSFYIKTERDRLLSLPWSTAPARVAKFLLDEFRISGQKNGRMVFTLEIKQLDIARFLAIRFETLTRVLNAFSSHGFICRNRRTIEILDIASLTSCSTDRSRKNYISYSSKAHG